MRLTSLGIGIVLLVFVVLNVSAADINDPDAPLLTALEGILSVVWGDPHATSSVEGTMQFFLTQDDGTISVLLPRDGQALPFQYVGQHVAVLGATERRRAGPSTLLVHDISIVRRATSRLSAHAVLGTRNVLFLLLRFSDDATVPRPPQFYADLTNPDTPPFGAQFPTTINGFFAKTSWNQFRWVADVGGAGGVPATNWLTLPYPKSYYANCGWESGCADVRAIQNDGIALGVAAGINFTRYDVINFVLSNDLDCCAYGGGMVHNGRYYGATWAPPWAQNTGSYVHELGHSLGLPHSGWLYHAYDSPWDIMSSGISRTAAACGSYYSRNASEVRQIYCGEPGAAFIAAHKDHLGWIPSANQVVTDSTSSTSVVLEANALPLGTAPKMLKICFNSKPCNGPAARYLTVETRVASFGPLSQYDNGLPGDGVIIHDFQADRAPIGGGNPCFLNSSSGWAVPRDATPGDWVGSPVCDSGGRAWPNYALGNAQWILGQTYIDQDSGVAIRVQSRSGGAFVIEQIGAPACVQDGTTACLLSGRFRANVRYRRAFDNASVDTTAFRKSVTGFASATHETAFFYFNSPDNIEILLKLLDQGNVNNQGQRTIAVLYGSATPLKTEIVITDTKTGIVRTYANNVYSQQGATDFVAFVK